MGREITDEQLLSSGTPDDFETFYLRYVDALTRYARRRMPSPELAFDVVSETFARALQHRRRYQPNRGPAVTWLMSIAANVIVDGARKGRVANVTRRRLQMEPTELDDEALRVIEERSSQPLMEALELLPEAQHDAIRRHVLQEEPYPSIAANIGCSEQVVRQRVHRGLRSLRRTTKETQA